MKSQEDLRAYARSLLADVSSSANDLDTRTIRPPARSLSPYASDSMLRNRGQEEVDDSALSLGCREAVEILTRNPKKLSYDVNKDGVKVAVLTFTKSAYRLGEPVLGVVELNERSGRARVLKLSAFLEAHESLPGCIYPTSNQRHMRRVHAEQHSSFTTSTLRSTFSLDIPPDASPAFQVDVKGQGQGSLKQTVAGGLEWKVRLCLLVSVCTPAARMTGAGDGIVRMKSLVRDGPRGEWGTAWKAPTTIAPQEWPDPKTFLNGSEDTLPASPSTAKSWMSFFTSGFLSTESGYHDGDDIDEDDETVQSEIGAGGLELLGTEEDWKEIKLEMVECEVPIKVWPGNTAFKAMEVVFDV